MENTETMPSFSSSCGFSSRAILDELVATLLLSHSRNSRFSDDLDNRAPSSLLLFHSSQASESHPRHSNDFLMHDSDLVTRIDQDAGHCLRVLFEKESKRVRIRIFGFAG